MKSEVVFAEPLAALEARLNAALADAEQALKDYNRLRKKARLDPVFPFTIWTEWKPEEWKPDGVAGPTDGR